MLSVVNGKKSEGKLAKDNLRVEPCSTESKVTGDLIGRCISQGNKRREEQSVAGGEEVHSSNCNNKLILLKKALKKHHMGHMKEKEWGENGEWN